MMRLLITAFDPYDIWTENSSWLALVEFTRQLPSDIKVVTRRYPVDFQALRERLTRDLKENYDFALHLGQAPGAAAIRLEAIGINVGGSSQELPDQHRALVADGPVAYRSALPLADWAALIREAGIPAMVSYHAGTFLCNATLYLSHYLAEQHGLRTQSAFVHLPLTRSQTACSHKELPGLAVQELAAALRLIVQQLAAESDDELDFAARTKPAPPAASRLA